MPQILTSTITSKGQVTIPIRVRDHLKVDTRDKITFIIESEGEVRLSAPKYKSVSSLKGVAGKLKKPLGWRQLKETAYQDRFLK